MKWVSELNRKYFWFCLSLKIHSPLAIFHQYKQTICRSFCLPASRRSHGLAASLALHYPPCSHRGPSFQWGQWKCQIFPPLNLRLQPWTFTASLGRLRRFATWSDVSEMLLLSHLCWCLLYFLLLGLSSPVPQKQACSLWNIHFLLKSWAVTGCKHHQFIYEH